MSTAEPQPRYLAATWPKCFQAKGARRDVLAAAFTRDPPTRELLTSSPPRVLPSAAAGIAGVLESSQAACQALGGLRAHCGGGAAEVHRHCARPQHLFDRVRHQLRVVTQTPPQLGMVHHRPDAVGHRVAGGVVAGPDEQCGGRCGHQLCRRYHGHRCGEGERTEAEECQDLLLLREP